MRSPGAWLQGGLRRPQRSPAHALAAAARYPCRPGAPKRTHGVRIVITPPILRHEDGRFVQGVSANPTGRPKGAGLLRDLFRGNVAEAVAVTVELLRDPDARIRQAAAAQIFDRVFGRPLQAIDSEVKKFDMNALYLAAVQLAQPAAPPMVDVTPEQSGDAPAPATIDVTLEQSGDAPEPTADPATVTFDW
jgi:hypothetical protein